MMTPSVPCINSTRTNLYPPYASRMKTENEQSQDKYASRRAADKTRELIFQRSPFLKPDKTARDEKLSDADLMRIYLHVLIAKFKWLGEVAHVNSSSQYDGFFRLIDLFVQFTQEGQGMPLGLEICLAHTESQIKTQIRAVIEEINGGQEFAIKYFDSPTTGKEKNVRMPKVLFAWTFHEARAILEAVDQSLAKAELKRNLFSHPLRRIFLDRTLGQLQDYAEAAHFVKNVEFATMHSALRDVIKSQVPAEFAPERR
jgi:hypothetical protein